MSQISFSDAEYAGKRKKTRREVFLEEMELVVPWKALLGADRAALPGGRPRPQAVPAGVDAAGAPDAELVCAERPGDGGGAVRDRLASRLRAAEPGRADSRRDDDPELSPPARSQRPGRGHPQGGQRAPGAQGPAAQARQHRGRHHHRRAELDQERRRRARPRDAPDQEGQPVALRHEGAHRGGCRQRPGAHGHHHGGQRGRRRADRRSAARQGTARVGRLRLPGRRKRAWTARTCSGTSPPGRATSPSCPRGAQGSGSRSTSTARPACARRSSTRFASSSASSG